ncbi:hypothetical protein An02g09490 [Aspergillus niger]|uniref:Uncharacterized protein n=2 Tax=Aspergillus niger TaxID=5061 RepID=A2QE58_ASPNC|nr:hypothetical protein An02g09490 [Aspergillus niger]CAK37819.1 hypothetical protein An02g09490 [Aspergillus niger]
MSTKVLKARLTGLRTKRQEIFICSVERLRGTRADLGAEASVTFYVAPQCQLAKPRRRSQVAIACLSEPAKVGKIQAPSRHVAATNREQRGLPPEIYWWLQDFGLFISYGLLKLSWSLKFASSGPRRGHSSVTM